MFAQLIRGCWLVYLVLLLRCCEGTRGPACYPQGLLLLGKPYPYPQRVELSFCSKYKCSCCNASHATLIQRSFLPIASDEELSRPCKAGLLTLACKVCDPGVGVLNRTQVCLQTCQQIYDACLEDYFSYDESSGVISPCTSGTAGMLVCSQLNQLVSNGQEFCRAAGHLPSSSTDEAAELCFDGSPAAAELCATSAAKASTTASAKTQSSSSSQVFLAGLWPLTSTGRLKRKVKRQLLAAGQLGLLVMLTAAVAVAVVVLLQRVMQAQPGSGTDVKSVREMLAKAAEVRAARLNNDTAQAADQVRRRRQQAK